MSTCYPSTVYSSDPALTNGGVPHPAPNSTPLPHISTATCYPSTLPNNPAPILYVADAPITPEAGGSFYFEVRVEELLPAPRRCGTTSSSTGHISTSDHRHHAEPDVASDASSSIDEEDGDIEDDDDIIQPDGPNNPPPLSDKPLTFIVGLTSDRLKMMTAMSTPGLAPGSIGYFNHQQMIYRGGVGEVGEVGGIPHEDADDSENYGDVATDDRIDDCDRTYVDEFTVRNGPDQRMRLGRVACVGCLVDFNSSTVRFTKNGTAMPVAALLGYNRTRLAASSSPAIITVPSLIPPGHARHYPLLTNKSPPFPSQASLRPSIYPVVSIPRNCGSQYLVHFTFMAPSSLSLPTVQHAAPLCRFPYSAWVHSEGEQAMRRQMASQTSRYAEEDGEGGHTHMLEMIMSHFTLRGMHDVVGTLEREVKVVEGGCPSPPSSPVPGGESSSNTTSCGATPIRIATDRPASPHTHPNASSTTAPVSSTAACLHDAYHHIEKGVPMKALHILRATDLSHLLPPIADIHPPPLTGSHFLSKRWDVVYWITLLQIISDVVVGSEREGWAQILVGAFDEVDTAIGGVPPTALSSLADQAIPHAYTPPERHKRLAAISLLLRLIASRPFVNTRRSNEILHEGEDMIQEVRRRVRLCTVAALETFLHDVRQQWVRMHDVVVRDPHCEEEEEDPRAPRSTSTRNAVVTLPPSSSLGTASSLRALVEDLRATVSLNAMSASYPTADRPTTNPLLPNSTRSATHVYARSIAERLGGVGWVSGSGFASASPGGERRATSVQPPLPPLPPAASSHSPVSSQWMSCSDSDDGDGTEWEDDSSSHPHINRLHLSGTPPYAQLPYRDTLAALLKEHLP